MTSPTPAAPTHRGGPGASKRSKVYGTGDTEVRALDDVTVDFETGRFTAIMGPSGSGKSTLMHCVAGLDTLTSGQRASSATPTSRRSPTRQLTRLRRDQVGFVFQAFNLVPTLTAIENITLPMDLAGRKPDPALGRPGRRHGRPRRPPQAPAQRAVRRPAAARRRGPGAGQPAGDHLRRRAHRQPRLEVGRRDPDLHAARRSTSSARPS